MRDEQGFADFASARTGTLRRQAYLLTGSPERAARVTERALADTGRRWDKLGSAAAAEEHARRAIVAGAVRARGAAPAAEHSPLGTALPADDSGEAVWRALAGLPPRRRAVLVLRYDEGLDDDAIGARLGVPAGTAAAEGEAGLAALRSLLRRRGTPEELLPAALADPARTNLAGAAPVPAPSPAPSSSAPAPSSSAPALSSSAPAPSAPAPVSVPSATTRATSVAAGSSAGGRERVAGGVRRPGRAVGGSGRRWWVAGAVLVAIAGIGAAVIVPALRDDPVAAAPGPVPAGAATGAGQLRWTARGPLAGDQELLRSALRTWRDGVPERQRPAESAVLYAGSPDGARIVLLQGTDSTGQSWLAQLTDAAGSTGSAGSTGGSGGSGGSLVLRSTEPLGRAVPLLVLPAGSSVRLLAAPETDGARSGLVADSGGATRALTMDADGLSEPVTPPAAGLPVAVTAGGTVAGSGTVLPGRLSAVTGPVELGRPALDLGAPGPVSPVWYEDGGLLARRLAGPVTVAAVGPVRTTAILVDGRPRGVDARAYEVVRGGTRYLAGVVRVGGIPTCVDAVALGPADVAPARPPVLVGRCLPRGARDGVLTAVAAGGVRTVRVQVVPATPGKPARVVAVSGSSGAGLSAWPRCRACRRPPPRPTPAPPPAASSPASPSPPIEAPAPDPRPVHPRQTRPGPGGLDRGQHRSNPGAGSDA